MASAEGMAPWMAAAGAQAANPMLPVLGFLMVATFMTLIMTRRLAPMVALIVVPVVFGLLAGHGLDLGPMMLAGVARIAPTGVMIMFAIL